MKLSKLNESDNLFDELLYDDEEEEAEPLTEATLSDLIDQRKAGIERKPSWREASDEELDEVEKKMRYILDNPVETNKPGLIETTLDEAYAQAKWAIEDDMGPEGCVNVLFYGPAGTGKTSRIKKWAKEKKVNLVHVLAQVMDQTDLGGAVAPDNTGTIVKRLASTELDALDEVPDSVLFLDEYNRAANPIRGTLLTLIQDHTIPDARLNTRARLLSHFLFTIAAMNQAGYDEDDDEAHILNQAEQTRFEHIKIEATKEDNKRYILKVLSQRYDKEMGRENDPVVKANRLLQLKRKFDLIEHLFADPDFDMDTEAEIAANTKNKLTVTARTLTNLINRCDGTKKDFLDKWDGFCNPNSKYKAVKALSNYKDIKNKANSVFNKNIQKRGDIDFIDLL